MALRRSPALVPMSGGLAEDQDPRVVVAAGQSARLLEARNVRFEKGGAIRKRNGFSQLSNLTTEETALPFGTRGIFSTGRELCVLGSRQLYSYVEPHARWYSRGQVGPADGIAREIYHSQHSFTCSDLEALNGYVLYVARSSQTAEPGDEYSPALQQVSIVQSVQTTGGASVIPPTEYDVEEGDDATAPHSPRACCLDSDLFSLWVTGIASPMTLWYSAYDTTDPATPPAAPVALWSDVWYDSVNMRTYDATCVNGRFVLAYIRNTDQAVMIHRYGSAYAVQASGSIAGPWYRVAIADSPTANRVYLLLVKDLGGGTGQVWFYALNRTSLAVLHSTPLVNGGLTADDLVMNLGLVENGVWVHSVWDIQRGINVRQSLIRHAHSLADTGGGVARPVILNATVRSRPYAHEGRTYCWLETAVAGVDEDIETVQFFEAAFAVDLLTDDAGEDFFAQEQPVLAGVHSVGAILPHGNVAGSGLEIRQLARQCGSANTVAIIGPQEYRYASTRIGRSEQDVQPRLSMDEIALCYGELPLFAVAHDGAAVIGGSFYTWFAGSQTEELSFVTPPIIEVKQTGSPTWPRDEAFGQTLPLDIYSYQAMWESSDPRGNVHRSLPGNIVQWDHDSLQAVRLAVRTCPASLRFPRVSVGRESAAIMHRAGADAVQRRFTRPVDLRANVPDAHLITILDYGQLFNDTTGSGTATPIYITGGAELEASCPEGGQIVAKVADRIWLADLYRRARVQYSKAISPQTGTEDVYVPELNELLGYTIPSGRPCTGIADLDGKAIVFTDQEIYVISGRGPPASGQPNDFTGLQTIATDTGCTSPRSVVSTPFGVLFASGAGMIYLLDRALQLSPIGAAVEETLLAHPYVTSAVLVPTEHKTEVRFTCNATPAAQYGDQGVILIWDYEDKQWAVWDVSVGVGTSVPFAGACLHEGVYHLVTFGGEVLREDSSTWYDDADKWIAMALSTAWLQGAGQSGWQRIYSATLLQESRDPHDVTVEVYNDFEPGQSQGHTWTAAELAAFPGYPDRQQLRMGIRRQKCQSIRVRVYDGESDLSVTGEGFRITGVRFELGVKRGTVKVAKEQRS